MTVAAAAPPIATCPQCRTRNRVPRSATGIPRCSTCHTPLPWLVEAGEADFADVTDSRLPVLVDLWAEWCGPCRIVAPAVEQASIDLAGRLKVVKVDVERAPSVSARLGVQGIPTLVVLRRGEEVARQVGALPADRLAAWLRGVLESP